MSVLTFEEITDRFWAQCARTDGDSEAVTRGEVNDIETEFALLTPDVRDTVASAEKGEVSMSPQDLRHLKIMLWCLENMTSDLAEYYMQTDTA
jgi:hypothetical protein